MKIRFYFLLLFFFSSSPLVAKAMQYENRNIAKIELSLAKALPGSSFNPRSVQSRLKTQEGTLFSEADFDSDLKLLAQEFDRVDPKVKVIDGDVHIALKVYPKPTIRTIIWDGNERVKTSRLDKELAIPLQSVFDRKSFNQAFRDLQKYYVKKGYFESKLRYEVDRDEATNEVDITVFVDEGRSGRIGKIKVEGVNKKEKEAIHELLYSQEYAIPISWFTERGTYREDFVQQDKLVVLDYLHNQGYAEARVRVEVEERESKERIQLTFFIERGPVYKTGKLTFSGNTLFDYDAIDSQFKIREGENFSPEKLRETVQSIQYLYGKKGYIDCVVDYKPQLDPDTRTYTVHFNISEGEQYRVGMIKVFGNGWTHTKVILHETLVIPGEVFDAEKLKLTEARLMNIGYFENVNVYAVGSEELSQLGGNYRDVHIEVEEKGTGSFGLSGGFSTRAKGFIGFNLTERNFDICGIKDIFSDGLTAIRGGGEYVHAQISLAQKETQLVLSWTKPYFMDSVWTIGVDMESLNSRVQSDDYDIKKLGFGLHASRPLNAFVRFGVSYQLVDSDVKADASASEVIKRAASNSGLISSVTLSLTYDSRNHPAEPTAGFFSRLFSTYAGLGGKYNYFSVGYLNSYYAPVTRDGVMKIRADVQQLLPVFGTGAEEIPLGTRYVLGGDDTVRGYKYGSIGDSFPGTDDPQGGITSILLSAEYMHPITSMLSAFVFIDGGSISMKTFNVKNFEASAGYGVRLKLVEQLPPVVIGMGYPINSTQKPDIFFTIGGSF